MWTMEQWNEQCEMMVSLWEETDEMTRRAMIGDLVAHSGDIALKDG
jgi:hypothetical protein